MIELPADVFTSFETARASGMFPELTLQRMIPEFIAARLGDAVRQQHDIAAAMELRRMVEERDLAAFDAEVDEDTPVSDAEHYLVRSALALAAEVAGREAEHLRRVEALVWDAVGLWDGTGDELVAAVQAQIPAGSAAGEAHVLAELRLRVDVEAAEGTALPVASRRVNAAVAAHRALSEAEEVARQARERRDARVRLAAEADVSAYAIAKALGVQPSTIGRILPRTTVTR